MSIPDYQSVMLPLLKYIEDGREYSLAEIYDYLAKHFELTDAEIKELLPSGKQAVFRNRVGWARTYLKKAGLIEYTKKAHFKISSRGQELLKENPSEINISILKRYPEFIEFKNTRKNSNNTTVNNSFEEIDPEEGLEMNYQRIRSELASELLDTIKKCSPTFFEKLVVELIVSMGYGGSRKDAGEAIGQSGDEGIDGIIKEDRLGLDIIYIQAKRWQGTVGRPEIQKFAGALMGKSAKKGIFITTANFSNEAIEYVKLIDSKIILIEGEQLASLMIDFDVGVTTVNTYEIKKIDSDYFIDEY
ncbi:Mrr restriction system protein [Candidatus Syntrophocurvum alkaliphilum]|uniref:Mrr restriction system protein n=1 Tax=Candidatus Syntrophocurvum alkaliphilum TaxID=2293317 RepID=A0A6I6DIV9_9FIRM|nr:restriction endonuclease [Candidatus Syntrophocurvum alkaliphilum]QGT99774.1 Mrr restriction system protein [Candidatus Syntrophocurvum alkaliphilum]